MAGELSFDRYLGSLEGERVELALSSGAVRGQLVRVLGREESGLTRCAAVAGAPAPGPCAIEQQTALLLLSEAGEVRRVATSEVKGVKPLDPLVQKRLRGAARARTGSATSEHALTVEASKRVERDPRLRRRGAALSRVVPAGAQAVGAHPSGFRVDSQRHRRGLARRASRARQRPAGLVLVPARGAPLRDATPRHPRAASAERAAAPRSDGGRRVGRRGRQRKGSASAGSA